MRRSTVKVEERGFSSHGDAAAYAEQKRAEGFNVRETRYKFGSWENPSYGYNVHVYEKKGGAA